MSEIPDRSVEIEKAVDRLSQARGRPSSVRSRTSSVLNLDLNCLETMSEEQRFFIIEDLIIINREARSGKSIMSTALSRVLRKARTSENSATTRTLVLPFPSLDKGGGQR